MNQIDVRITNASSDFLIALASLLNSQPVAATVQLTGTASETPPPFDPDLAVSVFGAKLDQAPPATPVTYVPPVPAATAQPSISNPPAASVGGGTPASAGVALDSNGRPWDARIHSSSHEKLAKTGAWKVARNKDPALVAQVLAELDAAKSYQASGAQTVYNVPPTLVQTPAPVYTPPTPVGPQYGDVVSAITGAIASGKIPPATVGGMLAHFGVKDIVDLENHAVQWPTIMSEIQRLSGAQ